jgi:hypothetical protein
LKNEEDVKKTALETYRIVDTIKKIQEFMFADLDKTIELANTSKGAPNFMLALVLCCYTEFWGKLKLGIPEGNSSKCFTELFKTLGTRYDNLLQQLGDLEIITHKKKHMVNKVYHDIRCGLAHSYLVEGSARIVIEGGHSGIEYDERTQTYIFYVRRYLEDFKLAVSRLIAEIEMDIDKFEEAKKVIKSNLQLI